jgi:prevent-host-death family protein
MAEKQSIGIRELRQHASRWLRRVGAGESFEITDRGRPIARLVPIQATGLDRLLAEGRASAAETDLTTLLEELGPPPRGPSATRALEDLRRDER